MFIIEQQTGKGQFPQGSEADQGSVGTQKALNQPSLGATENNGKLTLGKYIKIIQTKAREKLNKCSEVFQSEIMFGEIVMGKNKHMTTGE